MKQQVFDMTFCGFTVCLGESKTVGISGLFIFLYISSVRCDNALSENKLSIEIMNIQVNADNSTIDNINDFTINKFMI